MRNQSILMLAGLAALIAALLAVGLELPPAAAAVLGALLVVPLPLALARQPSLRLAAQHEDNIAALAASPHPLLLLDAEGQLLAFSRGLHQLAALPPAAHRQPIQGLPAPWQSLIVELHAEARRNGSSHRQQWLARADGQPALQIDVHCVQLCGVDASPQLLMTWTPLPRPEPALHNEGPPELAERKRAFLQTLIDVIPQPVYIQRLEADGSHYLLVNEAFCASHNRSRESLIGSAAAELLDPLQANALLQEDRAIAAGSVVFREEQAVDASTGQERILIVSKQSCLSPEGERVIVGTHFDITPWRLAEREVHQALDRERSLRERTQSFVQRIIDVIPYPVHVKDAHSRYLLVNEAFVRERGCSRAELLGHDPSQIARLMTDHKASAREEENLRAETSLREDRAVLAGDTVIKEEHNHHSVTGEERFRTVFKCACEDIEGQPAIVTAMFDITKWSIAERELQQTLAREKSLRERTQAFIQRFIDVIPQPLYIKDAQSRYLMINEAFARELRRDRSSVIGHSSNELAPSAGIAADSAREDAAVLGGAVILCEKRDQPYSGAPARERIISKRLCLDVDGQPIIVGHHVDINALRAAEQELQDARPGPAPG
ncbi:PAS domain-containing protein [Uliginosibacterium sp. 31-12]|uniref:PAS domain-containing protein n=1 Tax=Uliginosibacterium sp. 31-12 TaxID=3062781 RepID=UPI0026E2AA92|nr:PAS domain-containing protein [Uliginosibacterium sp. 31-12]MDO6385895.1 PAS domain-containing protein [Uliginosibacterium sp. 31-12]